MKLELDFTTMTGEQRQFVADFIVNYPSPVDDVDYVLVPESHTSDITAPITGTPFTPEEVREFNQPFPFVGGDAPLAPAVAAPDIVAAAVFSTAPAGGMPEVTSTAPASVPSPPVVSAELQPVVAAPDTLNPVQLDKEGLPYDRRIHSEGRTLNADGTWRKKRGVTEDLVISVETELRVAMQAPAPAVAAPIAQISPVTAFINNGDVITGLEAPAVIAGVTPPPPPADAKAGFVELIGKASAAVHAGKLTQTQITEVCQAHGLAALPLLANRLDLVPQVSAQLIAIIEGAV